MKVQRVGDAARAAKETAQESKESGMAWM